MRYRIIYSSAKPADAEVLKTAHSQFKQLNRT